MARCSDCHGGHDDHRSARAAKGTRDREIPSSLADVNSHSEHLLGHERCFSTGGDDVRQIRANLSQAGTMLRSNHSSAETPVDTSRSRRLHGKNSRVETRNDQHGLLRVSLLRRYSRWSEIDTGRCPSAPLEVKIVCRSLEWSGDPHS